MSDTTVPATGHRLTAPPVTGYARFLSTGSYRPERVVPNSEIVDRIDSSDQWIRERSGIESRRFARPDESVVDMAEAASRVALERAGLTGADIDVVLVATVTHPYQTPSAATLLAHRLGATPAAAFDISAACAGFCYGVALANDMIRAGTARHVLLVGVEKLTDFLDLDDRGSAFIFGDGAGAVVVGPSDTPGIGPTVWGSDGAQWDAIVNKQSWVEYRDSGHEEWPALKMAGQTVFRWAVWQMSPVAQKALDAAGVAIGDLGAFIPHQANVRIIDAMVKQMGLPEHVPVSRDIATSGNTSAASVPLAMDRMLAEGEAKSGDLALLIGFGAGLAYAAQVVELP
ncbi:beta-ketoacyl-ACP synthase III [Kineosporia sp. R_H_3]|uniref:beta-ketoacyl-ACP synthase III n=1 Tax=Kineosporia sp. R_H_3 TaxID=1961848 RepID=UPI000B4BAB1D|nr:beta-ketoacyl-ACP synthase III [Kineosporia sp. R_H_3]